MQGQEFSFKSLFVPLTTVKAIQWIVIVGFLVFGNMLFNGFVGDDIDPIVNNPLVHSIYNIPSLFNQGITYSESAQDHNYYRPILSLIYTLLYSLGGTNTFGYHFIQLIIHIVNTTLLYLLFKSFFKKQMSLLLALLFLVHPINTEAVVYISALGENLFLFFGLLTLYINKNPKGLYANFLIPILLLLSLLSKETGVVFLILIPFFNFLYNRKRLLISVIQILLVLIVYLFLRLGVAHINFNNPDKVALIQVLPLNERIINIPKVSFYYIKTFVFPLNLISFQTWIIKSINFNDFYIPLFLDTVFFVVLLSFGFVIYRNIRDYLKVYIFFLCWFILGLIILSQLFPLDQTVSERWFYFPIIGLIGIIGIFLNQLITKKIVNSRTLVVIAFCTILLFSIRVVVRNTNWESTTTLYTHDIRLNPDSYQLLAGLGSIANSEGNIVQAENYYIHATELFPNYINYINLGDFYLGNNRPKDAIAAYKNALRYKNTNALRWTYLGIAEYNSGDKKEAIVTVKKAYKMFPNNSILTVLHNMEEGNPIKISK